MSAGSLNGKSLALASLTVAGQPITTGGTNISVAPAEAASGAILFTGSVTQTGNTFNFTGDGGGNVSAAVSPSLATALAWSATVAYAVGDIVYDATQGGNDAVYICSAATTASSTPAPHLSTPAFWNLLVTPGTGGGGNWSYKTFAPSTAYALNDVVFSLTNPNQTYICILAYTTSATPDDPSANATNWDLFATNSATATATQISNGGSALVSVSSGQGVTAAAFGTGANGLQLYGSATASIPVQIARNSDGGGPHIHLKGDGTIEVQTGIAAAPINLANATTELVVGSAGDPAPLKGLFFDDTRLLFNQVAVGTGGNVNATTAVSGTPLVWVAGVYARGDMVIDASSTPPNSVYICSAPTLATGPTAAAPHLLTPSYWNLLVSPGTGSGISALLDNATPTPGQTTSLTPVIQVGAITTTSAANSLAFASTANTVTLAGNIQVTGTSPVKASGTITFTAPQPGGGTLTAFSIPVTAPGVESYAIVGFGGASIPLGIVCAANTVAPTGTNISVNLSTALTSGDSYTFNYILFAASP
jgi:hypothetical protein